MAHPTGVTVEIVGTDTGDRGRSCEHHEVCGKELQLDSVVRFRRVVIDVDGVEETAIAAYWVTEGVDRCRVGFLPRHLIKHSKQYEGKLGQIIEIHSVDSDSPLKRRKHYANKGCCVAMLIDAVPAPPPAKRARIANEEEKDSEKNNP
jgi:hypothetical protein